MLIHNVSGYSSLRSRLDVAILTCHALAMPPVIAELSPSYDYRFTCVSHVGAVLPQSHEK